MFLLIIWTSRAYARYFYPEMIEAWIEISRKQVWRKMILNNWKE